MKRCQLTLPAAAAACLALLCAGCTNSSAEVGPSGSTVAPATPEPTSQWQAPGPTQDTSGSTPTPLIRTLARNNRPIAAGYYFLPVTGPVDDPYPAPYHRVRAIVKVPPGYFGQLGAIVDGGSDQVTGANRERATLLVAGGIIKVDTQPCRGGVLVEPGPTVHDLAEALAPQATTTPRPVTIGGFDGLYLEIDPPDDLAQCQGGVHTPLGDATDDTPWTTRMWILDVTGHRVVVVVKTLDGSTHDPDEMVQMAENLMFVPLRAPH